MKEVQRARERENGQFVVIFFNFLFFFNGKKWKNPAFHFGHTDTEQHAVDGDNDNAGPR